MRWIGLLPADLYDRALVRDYDVFGGPFVNGEYRGTRGKSLD
jgi:hypothetical protein